MSYFHYFIIFIIISLTVSNWIVIEINFQKEIASTNRTLPSIKKRFIAVLLQSIFLLFFIFLIK